jgi:hypothetical protein
MPGFDGSGNYVRRYSWSSDQSNGLPISATKFDNDGNDVAGGFNICLTRDNQGKPSAPLIWSQSLTLNQSADGTNFVFARTGGTNNPTLTASVIDSGGVVKFNATGVTAQMQFFTQSVLAFTLSAAQAAVFAGTMSIGGNFVSSLNLTANGQTPEVAVTFNATTMTLNCSLSNVFGTTFTANVTVAPTISNPHDGQTIVWAITQDGTGTRTMTWPASFKWPNAVAGVLSTGINAVDVLTATYRAGTGFWYASLAKTFG